jgi:hypothetical protein
MYFLAGSEQRGMQVWIPTARAKIKMKMLTAIWEYTTKCQEN